MTFDDAFAYVIGVEAGYVNDPQDPGGETKFGISKRAYPQEDIPNLTLERAKFLYQRDYWTPLHGDELPAIALCLFDCAINQGLGTSIRTLQQVMRVAVDGAMGPQTLAVAKRADAAQLIVDFQTERVLAYSRMTNWVHDGRGWASRAIKTAVRSV